MGSGNTYQEEQFETIEIKVENRGRVINSTTQKFSLTASLDRTMKQLTIESLENLVAKLKEEVAQESATT